MARSAPLRAGEYAPRVTVRVDVDLSGLLYLKGALPVALRSAARRLAMEALASWRAQVAVRTGQMRDNLAWRVWVAPGGVVVIDFVSLPGGFYYRFQRRAPTWTAHLKQYIQTFGPRVLRREVLRFAGGIIK